MGLHCFVFKFSSKGIFELFLKRKEEKEKNILAGEKH